MLSRTCVCIAAMSCGAGPGQQPNASPKFEVADVQISRKALNPMVRTGPLVGPGWLEMDRFDVLGRVPPGTTLETLIPMLQGLLADRFKLVFHTESRSSSAYSLVAGSKRLRPVVVIDRLERQPTEN